MKEKKEFQEIIRGIQRDPKLRSGDKAVVCLNRACNAMLEDAYLLTGEGSLQGLVTETSFGCDQADEGAVRMDKDGEILVSFHESRPNSRDRRPNGIRVHDEERGFPCVVFCNTGEERLTVEGEWIAPGEWVAYEDADINSPEVQKALAELIRSPEVAREIERVRRQEQEKKREKEKQEKEGA